MTPLQHRRLWLTLLVAAGLLTGLRLFMAGSTELIPEETYYWTYAKHPAWGYFDHPPMVAWTVGLGTILFGDTEFGVRFVNIALWVFSCFALLRLGRLWFEERVALLAALLFVMLPIFAGAGFIVTPDGPLIFFWVLTLYAVSRALQTQRTGYWLLTGVAFGGALLSKYYAVLLAPSLFWFLLLSPRHRSWLKRPQPWLALLLGLLIFSPVIFWNANHQWASFAFQSTRTVAQKGNIPERLGVFWLIQLCIITPLGLALFGATAWRAVKRGWLEREDRWNFLASFALPLFLLFVAASFKTDVHVNWTAPAFLSLTLGASALWWDAIEHAGAARHRWWLLGTWSMSVLCGVAIILGHLILLTGKPMAYSHVGGWQAIANSVRVIEREQTEKDGQKPFIIGVDKYNTAAEMGFYLHEPLDTVNGYAFGAPGLSYRYWTDLRKFEGRTAVVIAMGAKPEMLAELKSHFDAFTPLQHLPVKTRGKQWQHVNVVIATGYHAIHKPTNALPALTESTPPL